MSARKAKQVAKSSPEGRISTAEGLDAIFRPRSVAVIGASRRPGSIGRQVFTNLLERDFRGPVFPVHPKEKVIQSIKAYPTVIEVPDEVDLAVIIVPRDHVIDVAKQCGMKGVRGLVVISAGFKETGAAGARREIELAEVAEHYGMRMIGPNCMGVLNADPEIRLDATFSKTAALPGSIALMSQSGALGEVILDHASQIGLGLSMFASVGNKADVSGNDLLLYWENDPKTKIILLYLESFGNPRRFTEIARRVTRTKPIVAVKAGRSRSGARAISSHTGTLAGSDIAIDALFEQCGVIRVDSVRELFDVALALDSQKPPAGRRLAIITNAGGPGILATDAAESRGFQMARLSPVTRRRLDRELPPEASSGNPVDLLAAATADRYRMALEAVLRDPNVDAGLVVFVPPVMVDAAAVSKVIVEAARKYPDVPLVGCFMRPPLTMKELEDIVGHRVPFYTFPEEAVFALDQLADYGQWLSRPRGRALYERAKLKHPKRVASLVEDGVGGPGSLTLSKSMELLTHAGVPVAGFASGEWADRKHLTASAARLGYPVVLKADVPSMEHKTERKLVRLDIASEAALLKAVREVRKAAPETEGWFLQKYVPSELEVLLGMTTHGTFGPLFAVGLGGLEVEVWKDVAFRLHPLTARDVAEMLQGLRGYPLLKGFRGGPSVSESHLKELMATLSRLVEEHPEIASLEMNPLVADPKSGKLLAVDARVMLGRTQASE